MSWETLIRESIWMSVAFSALMIVFTMGGLLYNREMWLNDYPPDVKAKWGPISGHARRLRNLYAGLLTAVIIGALACVPIRLTAVLGETPSFLATFVSLAIICSIFNLVDAFIIDLLILMTLFPQIMYLPGTEGMAGYHDMKLWAVNLLKGIPISILMALIGASLVSLAIWIAALL